MECSLGARQGIGWSGVTAGAGPAMTCSVVPTSVVSSLVVTLGPCGGHEIWAASSGSWLLVSTGGSATGDAAHRRGLGQGQTIGSGSSSSSSSSGRNLGARFLHAHG